MAVLNPLNGIKKLGFSQGAMIELTKSIFKVTIVGVIGYFAVKQLIENSVQLVDGSPQDVFSSMGSGAFALSMKISSAFIVLAAVDYYAQRKKFQRDTRMSKQEIKEEHKRDEGDPAIKGRMRREMIKRHRRRMMANVPKADVVVTNPTHYAIAIRYDAKKMAAPKVLAKGKDLIAQKIKEIAAEHNIPIVEDKPLAQLLYKTVEIDEQIPPDLFKAVAQILAYIYQMKKIRRGYGRS
jgi:flagellar biosynthetic protein FlhB